MPGFNAEVTKRVVELTTGIHLVKIHDASILKNEKGEPIITEKGERGIVITFVDERKFVFQQTYYLGGDREVFFNKMCSDANINLELAKTLGFKKQAKGKELWIFIKEVYDIDGEDLVMNDVLGTPIVNYYIFKTAPKIEPSVRPALSGDPEKNGGKPSGQFIEYRQIYKKPKTEEMKALEVIHEEDDFGETALVERKVELTETVKTDAGEVKANKAMVEMYNKNTMTPNNDFMSETDVKQIKEEKEIDFDDF